MRRLCVIGALVAAPLVASADPCGTSLEFAAGRTALAPPAKRAIEPTLAMLRAHPELHVQIVEPAGRDATLAKKRGEVVKWFLVDGGIEVDRIEVATGAVSGGDLAVQLAGCTAATAPTPTPLTAQTVTQTVSTTLAPAKPAVAPGKPAQSIVADASDLANLLAGDPAPRPRTGPSTVAPSSSPALTIGNDSVGFRDSSVGVHANTGAGGLRLASATLVQNGSQHREEDTSRATLDTGPKLGAEQPEGQPVKLDGRQLRALSRCYRKVPGLHPGDKGNVELTFIVDKLGRVKEPMVISDEDELIGCIGNVMTSWQFSSLRKNRSRIWVSVVLTAG